MKKLLGALPVLAIVAVIAFAYPGTAKATDYGPNQVLNPNPATYTFTGATPLPQVVNVAGYHWCTWTVSTGAVMSSTVLTSKTSGDLGVTYSTQSGTTDPGATPAPSTSLSAVGKVRYDVGGMTQWEATAASGGSSTNIVSVLNCIK